MRTVRINGTAPPRLACHGLPINMGDSPLDQCNRRAVVGTQYDAQSYGFILPPSRHLRHVRHPGWRGPNRRRRTVANPVDGPHLKGVGRPVGQRPHRMACGQPHRRARLRRQPRRAVASAIAIGIARDRCAAVVGWGLPCQRHRLVTCRRHEVLRRTRHPGLHRHGRGTLGVRIHTCLSLVAHCRPEL